MCIRDRASVTTSYVSLHGTPTGDIASKEARAEVMEGIPPRKEVPAGSSNSSEAFLTSAATAEDSLATMTDLNFAFKKMMDEMGRGMEEMEAHTQSINEVSERMTKATKRILN